MGVPPFFVLDMAIANKTTLNFTGAPIGIHIYKTKSHTKF